MWFNRKQQRFQDEYGKFEHDFVHGSIDIARVERLLRMKGFEQDMVMGYVRYELIRRQIRHPGKTPAELDSVREYCILLRAWIRAHTPEETRPIGNNGMLVRILSRQEKERMGMQYANPEWSK